MDNNRLMHSLSVARKMVEIAKSYNLTQKEINDCFIIGFNHDIGYEFSENGLNHNIIVGNILKKSGFKYWREIYYHGIKTNKYSSVYLDILNQADMQVDKYGKDVGYNERLKDIENRYGSDSKIYKTSLELINDLKNKKEVGCNEKIFK